MRALRAHDFPHGEIPAAVWAYTIHTTIHISFLCQRQIIAVASHSPAQSIVIDNARQTISSDSSLLRKRAIKRRNKKRRNWSGAVAFNRNKFSIKMLPEKRSSLFSLWPISMSQHRFGETQITIIIIHLWWRPIKTSFGGTAPCSVQCYNILWCAPQQCASVKWIATTVQHAGLSFK